MLIQEFMSIFKDTPTHIHQKGEQNLVRLMDIPSPEITPPKPQTLIIPKLTLKLEISQFLTSDQVTKHYINYINCTLRVEINPNYWIHNGIS